MPHFGLMDEGSMTPGDAELLRTRLHIRAARRRLGQGKVATGLVTLFDALLSALRWHAIALEKMEVNFNPGDERAVYEALVASGTLDGRLDFDSFNSLAEDAVEGRLQGYDYTPLLGEFESVMTALGIMPFDEAALPPERPGTP